MSKTIRKKRNPIAEDLHSEKYHQRIVRPKKGNKKYNRNNFKKEEKELIEEWENEGGLIDY